MRAKEIRQAYLDFFRNKDHAIIPRANLVPKEDPTTLFTGSGMQPLITYLLGAPHPEGKRLADSQTCFRAEDIDQVGDLRHTTFFEMLGNWSLGDYFKEEQLCWLFEFLINILKLDPNKIYATIFKGSQDLAIPMDLESKKALEAIYASYNVQPDFELFNESNYKLSRITAYDEKRCWWSRSGPPEAMPIGEPGGPDSEVFYLFENITHDSSYGKDCHPHCPCGRFVEIGNSVFMQFIKTENGFESLPVPNVDFGGGLERLEMAANNEPDVFKTSLLMSLIEKITSLTSKSYEEFSRPIRIIADHVRAVVFLACDGVVPSNTAQGYVMRRFIRRSIRQGIYLGIQNGLLETLAPVVIKSYEGFYQELDSNSDVILEVLTREEAIFRKTLDRGVREFKKLAKDYLDGKAIFTLFDTYGFPPELSEEEAKSHDIKIDPNWRQDFETLMNEQKQRSKTATKGVFKGGLADHSEQTTKLHTATHLLYKALRIVLGDHVIQRGSNITPERLRFDFSHPQKLTPEELSRVEEIVNENIKKDWPMSYREMTPEQAFKEGALGAFGDRYGDIVKVYTAGDPDGEWFSKEICGGPHVAHTGVLGKFKIIKEESSSAGVRRIKAILVDE